MGKKYFYNVGTVRWKKFTGDYDVRLYRAPKGWTAVADLLDEHPCTGKKLKQSQWWIKETYEGE